MENQAEDTTGLIQRVGRGPSALRFQPNNGRCEQPIHGKKFHGKKPYLEALW